MQRRRGGNEIAEPPDGAASSERAVGVVSSLDPPMFLKGQSREHQRRDRHSNFQQAVLSNLKILSSLPSFRIRLSDETLQSPLCKLILFG
jgi:hypothetical protein